jgi:hypothetical protein
VGCNFDEVIVERADMVRECVVIKTSHKVQFRSDSKSVSIVALGCLHPMTKVQSASIHFFLGNDDENEDQEDDVCIRFDLLHFVLKFSPGSRCRSVASPQRNK